MTYDFKQYVTYICWLELTLLENEKYCNNLDVFSNMFRDVRDFLDGNELLPMFPNEIFQYLKKDFESAFDTYVRVKEQSKKDDTWDYYYLKIIENGISPWVIYHVLESIAWWYYHDSEIGEQSIWFFKKLSYEPNNLLEDIKTEIMDIKFNIDTDENNHSRQRVSQILHQRVLSLIYQKCFCTK